VSSIGRHVDGTTVLSDVSFATASAYLKVAPGSRTVEIRKGGSSVLEVPADLEAGTKVTAYVIGNASPEEGDAGLSAVTSPEATRPGGTGERAEDRRDEEDETDDKEDEEERYDEDAEDEMEQD
jgi:hypothetical protein